MEKCLIACASTGLESETGVSSLLVSCACERSESQISMRFSLVYIHINMTKSDSMGIYAKPLKMGLPFKDNQVSCWFEISNHFELTLGFM